MGISGIKIFDPRCGVDFRPNLYPVNDAPLTMNIRHALDWRAVAAQRLEPQHRLLYWLGVHFNDGDDGLTQSIVTPTGPFSPPSLKCSRLELEELSLLNLRRSSVFRA
jgi:hypothetical protein